MSTADQMTQVIMDAWDEIEGTEESTETAEPVETTAEVDVDQENAVSVDEAEEEPEDEAPAEEDDEALDDEDEEEAEPDEEEVPGEDEPEPDPSASDDPEIQGFVARHGGDVESALKDAVRLESVLGRQGRELGQGRERIAQLEADLERAQLFTDSVSGLNEEQVEWVEQAAVSDNPVTFIQSAVNAGEFELARAVLDRTEIPAGQALRIAQSIDRAEQLSAPAEPTEPTILPVNDQRFFRVLSDFYPDMPQFEKEMVSSLAALGSDHPLAQMAKSPDPETAAQGIIGLYEIARAKTATVTSTREQVKKRSRDAAKVARDAAVVSSGAASPQGAQVARKNTLMPGLTLESLDAAFDAES